MPGEMTTHDGPQWSRLYEIAAAQEGHFTTVQAATAGYYPQLLTKHLGNGGIVRVRRGVYRLAQYPPGDHEELVVLWLWSDRAGVFSHETALVLHQLSDALPATAHMTLPRRWEARRLRTPDGVELHFADLTDADRAWAGAVPVTTCARTLVDCADSGVLPSHLGLPLRDPPMATQSSFPTGDTPLFAVKFVKDGAATELNVHRIKPLDLTAYNEFLRSERRVLTVVFWGTHRHPSDYTVSAPRPFSWRIEPETRAPFDALVAGGVLAPQFLLGRHTVCLDRNMGASFARGRDAKHPEAADADSTFNFLNHTGLRLNPTLGAFEGGSRRTPTFEEFRSDVREMENRIRKRLPAVEVVPFSDDGLVGLHAMRCSFESRDAIEQEFLLAVVPLLTSRISAQKLESVERAILKKARELGLKLGFVLLAALALLYESPHDSEISPARAVLKPLASYDRTSAYNALSDLRQMEIFAASHGLDVGAGEMALLTSDKGLARLWCGVNVVNVQVSSTTVFQLQPDPALFPRLTERRGALFDTLRQWPS
ncbi:MAG: hypothetical protein GC161_01975 [Planctomycetaceae bacterium]|nr:hypothetical protein [Planctomycetaceae bacterium]